MKHQSARGNIRNKHISVYGGGGEIQCVALWYKIVCDTVRGRQCVTLYIWGYNPEILTI